MIDLIVMDVDGCLTDGSIIYTNSGDELKSFNVKDGFAIVQWLRLGKEAAIITGRKSKIVEHRARELGIEHLYQCVRKKDETLKNLSRHLGISLENVAAIGDDLNDYRLLKEVGLSFAPADAVDTIRQNVDVVLKKKGGEGAVREMIEYILRLDGLYEEYLHMWM